MKKVSLKKHQLPKKKKKKKQMRGLVKKCPPIYFYLKTNYKLFTV